MKQTVPITILALNLSVNNASKKVKKSEEKKSPRESPKRSLIKAGRPSWLARGRIANLILSPLDQEVAQEAGELTQDPPRVTCSSFYSQRGSRLHTEHHGGPSTAEQPERRRSPDSKQEIDEMNETKTSPRSRADKVDRLMQMSLFLRTQDDSKRHWREDFFQSRDVSFAAAQRREVELQDEEWMKQKEPRGVIPAYSHAHKFKRPAKDMYGTLHRQI